MIKASKTIKIKAINGTGAMITDKCPITSRDVMALCLENKEELLAFQQMVNEFVENMLKVEKEKEAEQQRLQEKIKPLAHELNDYSLDELKKVQEKLSSIMKEKK